MIQSKDISTTTDARQTAAIRRRLETHARSCTYYIFSGDRHCSCGREQALQELEAIERSLAIEMTTSGANKKV